MPDTIQEPVQTFKNHARIDVPFLIAILILAVNLVTVTITAIRFNLAHFDLTHFAWLTLLWIGVAYATLVVGIRSRTNALKAQDRVIRLEERIRYATTLPTEIAARAEALSVKQIVALRFASDPELPALITRTLTESLTPKQIKQSITTWRPDLYRV